MVYLYHFLVRMLEIFELLFYMDEKKPLKINKIRKEIIKYPKILIIENGYHSKYI